MTITCIGISPVWTGVFLQTFVVYDTIENAGSCLSVQLRCVQMGLQFVQMLGIISRVRILLLSSLL